MMKTVCAVSVFLIIAALAFGSHFRRELVPFVFGPQSAAAEAHVPYEGFGAATTGGAGRAIYRVTNLADSGPGSLRDAVSASNRHVVFDVAGEIVAPDLNQATREIYVKGQNITIDGFTAPSPGITLRNYSIRIVRDVNRAAYPSNIIVRGLRIRQRAVDAPYDCIGIYGDIQNVVVDHVSLTDCEDGAIDVGYGARDVTIQWSVLNASKVALLGYQNDATGLMAHRISMHHNILTGPSNSFTDRLPRVRPSGGQSTDTLLDFRHNIVRHWWRSTGTKFEDGSWGNVVGNTYVPGPDTPAMEYRAKSLGFATNTRVHTAGNVDVGVPPATFDYNTYGNVSSPLPAPPITPSPAACVRDHAGAYPRDARDQALLGGEPTLSVLGSCSMTESEPPTSPDLVPRTLSAPSSAKAGQTLSVSITIANAGAASASGSTARLYLSTSRTLQAGSMPLASIAVPSLAADGTHSTTTSITVRPSTTAGNYHLLIQADDTQVITESSEWNNTVAIPMSITTASTATAAPSSAAPSSFVPILINAESMALVAPLTIGSDAGALGGRYITPTSGGTSTTLARDAAAAATVPSAGTYYLWARMYGPSAAADAFYIGINSSWTRVHPGTTGAYQWVRIKNMNASNGGFPLAAGTHTIQVARAEANARLDAVYLTNNATDVPRFSPASAPSQPSAVGGSTPSTGSASRLFSDGSRVAIMQSSVVYLAPAGSPRPNAQPSGARGAVTTGTWASASWWYFVDFDAGMDGWVRQEILSGAPSQ